MSQSLVELTFIDYAGVDLIVDSCVRADRAPCRVVIIQGSPEVRKVFALTRLDRPTSIVADPGEIDREDAQSALTFLTRR